MQQRLHTIRLTACITLRAAPSNRVSHEPLQPHTQQALPQHSLSSSQHSHAADRHWNAVEKDTVCAAHFAGRWPLFPAAPHAPPIVHGTQFSQYHHTTATVSSTLRLGQEDIRSCVRVSLPTARANQCFNIRLTLLGCQAERDEWIAHMHAPFLASCACQGNPKRSTILSKLRGGV